MTENQQKLIAKLEEMFQFDQADLDFGIYRIMAYKRDEIKKFLNEDLTSQINKQLNELLATGSASELEKIQKEIENAQKMAVSDTIKAAMITELEEKKKAVKAVADIAAVEADIYSHLTNFFSRYYDEGDFISQRRYKDGVYAIPYEGEEVKLYWANSDQYYVKTSEYFKDYTFKTEYGNVVHFKIVEAETEKDNNKQQKKRFFQLYLEKPFEIVNDELFIYFEYKEGDLKKQDDYNQAVVAEFAKVATQYPDFASLLKESDGKNLLERQLNRYTARNTFDYFIHKDLGKFLTRELDFYIKNEVVFLDDIDEQDEQKTKQYLVKAKVIRNIGRKIISFLAQIEDFQKKLWLKKKFVVETNYCITLDRVPEKFYPEIINNQAQIDEWKKLFAIDEIKEDLLNTGYSEPLTIDFLKQNPYLVLDTAFFSNGFKEELIESIDDLDEKLDGLLIHSENFQALNLLQERYKEQAKCIYIDPPYNSDASEILYKNGYKHSSWSSLIKDRLYISKMLMRKDAIMCVTIDDFEMHRLWHIIHELFSEENELGTALIRNNPQGRSTVKGFAVNHEYALFFAKSEAVKSIGRLEHSQKQKDRYSEIDEKGIPFLWENFRKTGTDSNRADRPKQFYPIYTDGITIQFAEMEWDPINEKWDIISAPPDLDVIWPISDTGEEKVWKWGIDRLKANTNDIKIERNNSNWQLYRKNYINEEGSLPGTWWDKPKYAAGSHGTNLLTDLFGITKKFPFPKSVYAVEDCLRVSNEDLESIILDYFAGSGTTGHAVINLNREDGGNRKYILLEMGEYFDTVTKPRIEKVIYSKDWKDGKPVSREGSSHAFKYLRLESYEDTLNNIEINDEGLGLLSGAVKEQYLLKYMLTKETKGSVSLLNIDLLAHPFDYKMNITQKLESKVKNIDLVETFNYLIGLIVERSYAIKGYDADFITGEHGAVTAKLRDGDTYKIKMVEGRTLNDDRVLVIWRDLTGDAEKDNAVLDAFFEKKKINTTDFEYKKIYVNGDNNLPNLRSENESWKVILIEEEMKKRMFDSDSF